MCQTGDLSANLLSGIDLLVQPVQVGATYFGLTRTRSRLCINAPTEPFGSIRMTPGRW